MEAAPLLDAEPRRGLKGWGSALGGRGGAAVALAVVCALLLVVS